MACAKRPGGRGPWRREKEPCHGDDPRIAAKGRKSCDQPPGGRDIVVVQAADKFRLSLMDSSGARMARALGSFHEKTLCDPWRVKLRHHMPNKIVFFGATIVVYNDQFNRTVTGKFLCIHSRDAFNQRVPRIAGRDDYRCNDLPVLSQCSRASAGESCESQKPRLSQ
jgi:hypothetical protein